MIGNRLQQNIKNHKLSTWVEEVDTDGHRTASLRSSSKFVAEFVEPGSLPNRPHPKNQKTPFRGSSLRINSIFSSGSERRIDASGLAGRKHP